MKKYLPGLTIFLFLSIFFSFQDVTLSHAGDSKLNATCGCGIGHAEEKDCSSVGDYLCGAGLQCVKDRPNESCGVAGFGGNSLTVGCGQNHCKEDPNAPSVKCRCEANNGQGGNNSADSGKNGILCDGAPTFYCNNQQACEPAANNQITPDEINTGDGKDNIPPEFKNKVLKDVRCHKKNDDGTAICTCSPPTVADHGNFDCYKEGDPNKAITGHGHCGSDSDVCTNTPGQSYDSKLFTNYSGDLFKEVIEDPTDLQGKRIRQKSLTIKGIVCGKPPPRPATPTLPPPPPPPCASPGIGADGKCGAFSTALGEIATEPGAFLTNIFAILLAVSGGIALLLIIRAGYMLMTSVGKPDKITAARDQLVAAIVGLLFIIFSFIILQVIGVDILKIPGLRQ